MNSQSWIIPPLKKTSDDDIHLARNILNKEENWMRAHMYQDFKHYAERKEVTEEFMRKLLVDSLNSNTEYKIFKSVPERKLSVLLLDANILQFSGKKTHKKSKKGRGKKKINKRSKTNKK